MPGAVQCTVQALWTSEFGVLLLQPALFQEFDQIPLEMVTARYFSILLPLVHVFFPGMITAALPRNGDHHS